MEFTGQTLFEEKKIIFVSPAITGDFSSRVIDIYGVHWSNLI
jgi:hypothetical protein